MQYTAQDYQMMRCSIDSALHTKWSMDYGRKTLGINTGGCLTVTTVDAVRLLKELVAVTTAV